MTLETWRTAIDEKLSQLIESRPAALHEELFEAARYALLGPGKRLRPLLLLAAADAFEQALVPACALEMIHAYSLVHDDLPCMDDDDMRRGKPSLHKAYTEGHAVLTGDFLLTFAFQVVCEAPGLSAEQKLDLTLTLSKAAGADGMIGGQVVDIVHAGKELDWETLQFIHLNKTAALIAAALECGAIVGKASAADRALLRHAGEKLGLAFQIADDLTDNTSAACLLGQGGAQKVLELLRSEALESIAKLSRKAPALAALASALF